MKATFLFFLIAMIVISCVMSTNQENHSTVSQKEDIVIRSLPDSFFYKVKGKVFDIPSVPYDESTRTRNLRVMTDSLFDEVSSRISEMRGIKYINLYYLSKEAESEKGCLITIYSESEIDPGSIYLLSFNEKLKVTDYKKIGFEKCDLEQQTDTCEVVACEEIISYRITESNYAVVHKNEKEYDCESGKRRTAEVDSIQLTINDGKFLLKKYKDLP